MSTKSEIAVLGGGCFWCTEAVFSRLRGVISVIPGYAGGETPDPTYVSVSSGTIGHAEVVRIAYDAPVISYEQLLEVFFATHDPTTLNRQGADHGTQYRSIILTSSPEQEKAARTLIARLTAQNVYPDPIVTEIKPLGAFYPAEHYHQRYYELNTDKPYCQIVINPKLHKLKMSYFDLLSRVN
ncbi:MAG TPA: peptide-methionine (S)-S-oxide reductase MsrA [bacterium]|nr:peptide-methionine (S)-S-oxide reductase MsrA [bacterium]